MTEVIVNNAEEVGRCLSCILDGLSKDGLADFIRPSQLQAFSSHVDELLAMAKDVPDGCRLRISRRSLAVCFGSQVLYEMEYPLLPVKQYADIYGISIATAKRWAKRMHNDFYTENSLRIRDVGVPASDKAFVGMQDLFFLIDLCFMKEVLRCQNTGEKPQVFVSK